MAVDFSKPLDWDDVVTYSLYAIVILCLIGVGGWWAYGQYQERQSQNRTRASFECERDVELMRGDAGDFQNCLTGRGWEKYDAIAAANRYFVTHH